MQLGDGNSVRPIDGERSIDPAGIDENYIARAPLLCKGCHGAAMIVGS